MIHAYKMIKQNDVFILSIVTSFVALEDDNLDMLRGLLPTMKRLVKDVYNAAVEMGPFIEARPSGKLPLWAVQSENIVNQYPALMIKLRALDTIVEQQRVTEVRRELATMFKISATIQLQLLKVSPQRNGQYKRGKLPRPVLFIKGFQMEQFSEEIKK